MVAFFGVADTDVQLGFASGSGLRGECRRSRAGVDFRDAAAECSSDNDSLPRSQAHQVVKSEARSRFAGLNFMVVAHLGFRFAPPQALR